MTCNKKLTETFSIGFHSMHTACQSVASSCHGYITSNWVHKYTMRESHTTIEILASLIQFTVIQAMYCIVAVMKLSRL